MIPINRGVQSSKGKGGLYWKIAPIQGVFAIVDDQDASLPSHLYLVNGYPSFTDNGQQRRLHQWVAERAGIVLKFGEQIDHYPDREKTNCQRNNLRAATRSMQSDNQGLNKDSSTGFRGVSRSRKKFVASMTFKGRRVFCRTFETAEEASAAYEAARLHRFD